MIDIPLNPIPSKTWEDEYNILLKDKYLSQKYNRERRLKDKEEYISKFLPEISKNGFGNILDLGTGMGEFLEILRLYGYNVSGIDAKLNDCEMGDEYIRLSKLMTERQNLNVKYIGFENILLTGQLPYPSNYFTVINSQGSIEQIFKNHLKGISHKVHKDSKLLEWVIDEKTIKSFKLFFSECHRILNKNGIILIYANGSKDDKKYHKLILDTCSNVLGLKLIYTKSYRIHKFRKIV